MKAKTWMTWKSGDLESWLRFQFDSETGDRTADRRKSNAPKIPARPAESRLRKFSETRRRTLWPQQRMVR